MPPPIIDCNAWGAHPANNRLLNQQPSNIIIHHTADPNNRPTDRASAISLARRIQNTHISWGWGDSGQHFLVTRGGFILEGRRGSLAALTQGGNNLVQGAHEPRRNNDSIGIENEGTYTSDLPPWELWDTVVELSAYICQQYGMPATAFEGHRRYRNTECPGTAFFNALGNLSRDVQLTLNAGFLPPRGVWQVDIVGGQWRYLFRTGKNSVDYTDLLNPQVIQGSGTWTQTATSTTLRIDWQNSYEEWSLPLRGRTAGTATARAPSGAQQSLTAVRIF
jgi:hypothetical protein